MPVKTKPVTKKQIREVADSYQPMFSDWKFIGGQAYVRMSGPVLQSVSFEALRSGGYRPSSAIEILVAPSVVLLHQFLDIQHRETLLRDHENRRTHVRDAMQQQFEPSIVQPLNAEEVFRKCEASATERISDACGVAALAGYLGKQSLALSWCDKGEAAVSSLGRDPADWEMKLLTFTRSLKEAIASGNERQLLDAELRKNIERFQ